MSPEQLLWGSGAGKVGGAAAHLSPEPSVSVLRGVCSSLRAERWGTQHEFVEFGQMDLCRSSAADVLPLNQSHKIVGGTRVGAAVDRRT